MEDGWWGACLWARSHDGRLVFAAAVGFAPPYPPPFPAWLESRLRPSAARMLTHLSVRNFAVVEAAEIELGAGLTVVTGETGAGKSLLVDALLLLSGARADTGMVRAGCDRAEIAAEFDLANAPAARA